jgi:transcriptional regulator with PAS, ATPase and Fis domain
MNKSLIVKMLAVIPYPEMKLPLRGIIDKHPQKDLLHVDIIRLTISDVIPDNFADYDVIVGRGYALDRVRQVNTDIPCISIDVNALDVLEALNRCINTWHPRKIGYIWSSYLSEGLETLFRLYDVEVAIYRTSHDKLEEAILQSIEDGCDAHIGGYGLYDLMGKYHLRLAIVESGIKAMSQAVDEAIRTVRVIKRERESSGILRAIVQRVPGGIIHIDETRKICAANSYAKLFGNKIKGEIIGRLFSDVFPWMDDSFEKVSKGEQIQNELHHFNDHIISASYDPVVVEAGIAGVIVTFQDITDIQRQETLIRKKLSEKGNVARYHFHDIIGSSNLLQKTISTARKYAHAASNILLAGETGTGKELLAQSIHNCSERRNGPFVAVNCAALSDNLLESELFGYVEGAFTGASKGGKMGLFEQAHMGTLFLDEITEMPISVQGKLLRVLQEREVRRLGDNKVISVDLRLISATNKNIGRLVEEKLFREDLLYRIDVLKICIPPVRMRKSDIVEIFMNFMHQQSRDKNLEEIILSPQAAAILSQHDFLGNVREIRNIAERVLAGNTSGIVDQEEIFMALYPDDVSKMSIHKPARSGFSDERHQLERILREAGNNKTRAAQALGIERSTLWRRMKKYGMIH